MAGKFVIASSQYIDQDANAVGLQTPNGSLCFFMNGTDNSTTQMPFSTGPSDAYSGVGGSQTGGSAVESVYWQHTGTLAFYIVGGEGLYNDGADHHICIICDGVDNRILVDGVEPMAPTFITGAANTANGFIDSTINQARIAGYLYSALYFQGALWDMRIYNRGLSDAECKIIYEHKGNDSITNGLKARWLMNEAADGANMTVNTDYSGNAYDGSPQNTPTYVAKPTRIG